MSRPQPPELKKYLDKLVFVNMQGNRKVSGYLRGYDIFLNVVVDDAREETIADKVNCGTVVVRGSSVTSLELAANR